MTAGRSSGRTRTLCLPGGPRWIGLPAYADHRRTQGQTASTVPQAAVVCGARTAPSTVRDRWAWHGNAAQGRGLVGKTTTTPPHKRWPLHGRLRPPPDAGSAGIAGTAGVYRGVPGAMTLSGGRPPARDVARAHSRNPRNPRCEHVSRGRHGACPALCGRAGASGRGFRESPPNGLESPQKKFPETGARTRPRARKHAALAVSYGREAAEGGLCWCLVCDHRSPTGTTRATMG